MKRDVRTSWKVLALLGALPACELIPLVPPEELDAAVRDAPLDLALDTFMGIPVSTDVPPLPDTAVDDALPAADAPDSAPPSDRPQTDAQPTDTAVDAAIDVRPPDASTPPDASLPPDASTTPDASVAPDVWVAPDVPRDVYVAPDLWVPPDVYVAPDVWVPPDVAPPLDVWTPPDVFIATDVFAPLDVPPPRDVYVPPDVYVLPDIPPPPDAGVALDLSHYFSPLDTATIAHIRDLRARAITMGTRPAVFAKIGDSITESASFLMDIGHGWYDIGPYTALEPTIWYFRATRLADGSNSLTRASSCAMGGWIAAYALSGDPMSALRREMDYTRPGYTVLMYGTNDLDRMAPAPFIDTMGRIVDIIESYGSITILTTIPDRLDRPDSMAAVPGYNTALLAFAAARHLPIVDLWRALQTLPNRGVDPDGIHPSAYVVSGNVSCGILTETGLRYGYNMRNLLTLYALDRLRALP